MTVISTWSHLGHSNNRCSKPIGPGETRSSIIRAWQREQRGRSMAVRDCWVEDTVIPLYRREHDRTLCHRWLPMAGGDAITMTQRKARLLVNTAHSRKFQNADTGRRNRPPPASLEMAGNAWKLKNSGSK
jgi:hypothetical protein